MKQFTTFPIMEEENTSVFPLGTMARNGKPIMKILSATHDACDLSLKCC